MVSLFCKHMSRGDTFLQPPARDLTRRGPPRVLARQPRRGAVMKAPPSAPHGVVCFAGAES